jgi:hypothetical protein
MVPVTMELVIPYMVAWAPAWLGDYAMMVIPYTTVRLPLWLRIPHPVTCMQKCMQVFM